MAMSIQAANPQLNATVTASAGSGKTYMLVTRILRLLLEGIDPGSILALTFTRKAAAEMQQRLSERLFQLATADEPQLATLLKELELGPESTDKARRLYEFHQYCDYPVRTLTFHSFCQDLLSRFPLEADIPPNFDLLESSDLYMQQARDALFNEATLNMQGQLAVELQQLQQTSGSLFSLEKSLYNFLHHRSDWWAYTDGQKDTIEFARTQLAETLGINPTIDPVSAFFNDRLNDHLVQQIGTFAKLLAQTGGKKNLEAADILANWLVETPTGRIGFDIIRGCFLTASNAALVQGRKDCAALRKKLNDDADEFLELHERLSQRIIDTLDQINKHNCWTLNSHWYYCGEKLLHHYQQLKRQQRLLDFTDLEWHSYKLLQDSENAEWIQYKLDQKIQHLLIDEFQDTNPTQWQLILPLLEEMAAAESEQPRSVFLVGDEKQSIYSFRRAKPELQQQASVWLQQHLNAKAFPLNKSWRSSPAIINTVNAVFTQEAFQQSLPDFTEHQTHHEHLAGRVEVFPVWQTKDEEEPVEPPYCRNPLLEPRTETTGLHHYEAQHIAQHIQQLISKPTLIEDADKVRPLNYNDIFILVRKRSHVAEYEKALREAGIAYLGTNRGTFLSCLEIQDMDALLDTLLTPFNNLSLAQVLKSPLFNASDNDLQLIAQHYKTGNWMNCLAQLSTSLHPEHVLCRAYRLLTNWHQLADKIPVHDLLDRIFDEGDLLKRYQLATPASLQNRVQANLTLFLEMALDLDSGRYPSLMNFLNHLRSLRNTPSDAPDEAPMETREPRVRIMTIHASKGLEAPVVYLADTINTATDRSALNSLVDWPVEQTRPQHFLLLPPSTQQDSVSQQLNQLQKDNKIREDANLLYVAMTRARQFLFVSGCRGKKGPFIDWHQPVFKALQTLTQNEDEQHLCYETGNIDEYNSGHIETDIQQTDSDVDIDIDKRLLEKISQHTAVQKLIAPSKSSKEQISHLDETDAANIDDDAQLRGIAIHRMLELLCTQPELEHSRLVNRVSHELQLDLADNKSGNKSANELTQYLQQSLKIHQHPELQHIFKTDDNCQTFNECPVYFMQHDNPVYGVIDRVLVDADSVHIIDYKTHQHATANNVADIARQYQQQMTYYATACQQLWPDKTILSYLLFTECAILWPVQINLNSINETN